MWDRIEKGQLAGTANSQPRLPGVSNATVAMLNAAGWHVREYEAVPEGQQATGYKWAGLQDGKSCYVLTGTAPMPEPEPTIEDRLAALESKAVRIEADVAVLKEAKPIIKEPTR